LTYIGVEEKNKHSNKKTKGTQGRSVKTKTPVIGVVERKGEVVAKVVENTKSSVVMPFIKENVEVGTNLMTDTYPSYNPSSKMGYNHQKVDHGNGEYVKDDIYTNTLEGFWSQMKRSIDGTYHMVSPNHLQKYVNEFAFRYNHNHSENHLFKTILNSRIKNNLSV
jgi:transposase-like protein